MMSIYVEIDRTKHIIYAEKTIWTPYNDQVRTMFTVLNIRLQNNSIANAFLNRITGNGIVFAGIVIDSRLILIVSHSLSPQTTTPQL